MTGGLDQAALKPWLETHVDGFGGLLSAENKNPPWVYREARF